MVGLTRRIDISSSDIPAEKRRHIASKRRTEIVRRRACLGGETSKRAPLLATLLGLFDQPHQGLELGAIRGLVVDLARQLFKRREGARAR